MRIRDIDALHAWDGHQNHVFVRVHTDEGILGGGEASSKGPDEGVLDLLGAIKPWFIGHDASRIEWLVARARNNPRFPAGPVGWAALSGIEQALWDIAGKAAGVPVYALLGGTFRDRVRVYRSLPDHERTVDAALALMEEGYTAFKISPFPKGWRGLAWNETVRGCARRVEDLRASVGEDLDLAIDLRYALSETARARELIEVLAPYRPMFVQGAMHAEDASSMAGLRDQLRVPLAAGSSLSGVSEYVRYLDAGAVDVVQPDLCLCGGILEAKKIASVAEASYVNVAPHNPLGLLSTAANVHFAASTPNFLILEYPGEHDGPGARLVDETWRPVDGYLPLPTRPGLGMDLDLEAISGSPARPWTLEFPAHPDGSPALV